MAIEQFHIESISPAGLGDVAQFLHRWRATDNQAAKIGPHARETVVDIERRLRWLLVENPLAGSDAPLGYCIRNDSGLVRGLNLAFPAAFTWDGQRVLGLGSGSFFVEPPARSLGFFLFKKYLSVPGYSFYFATTCNENSGALWSSLGGGAVPQSETEYILPLRLDRMLSSMAAAKTSSGLAAGIARVAGMAANPALKMLNRRKCRLSIEPCRDWKKLADLARMHQCPNQMASDRTVEFLKWRYGVESPMAAARIYVFRDQQGNEGWFSLCDLIRGKRREIQGCVMVDAIWPRERLDFGEVFNEMVAHASPTADAIFLRSQPAFDYRTFSRFVVPYALGAPRVYVKAAKQTAAFPLDAFDYDDSDYGAWRLPWTA